MENAFGTGMWPTGLQQDPIIKPPDPRWVHLKGEKIPHSLYKIYTADEELARRKEITNLLFWGASVTALSYIKGSNAATRVQRAQHIARMWERRCMNLQGRERAPYVPSAMQRIMYGKRGQFWDEELESPWKKMYEETAIKRKPDRYDMALKRTAHFFAWPVRRFDRYLHPTPKVSEGGTPSSASEVKETS